MSCVNREQLRKDLLLYAVTDRSWLGNETLYEQVEKALKGGATFIQLREKELDEEHFMEEAVALKELCHKYHVPFVINDNVRIAKDMDADGVHVGQSDMEADDVRKILGEDKILGVSAQTVEQAVLAEKMGADYLGVGAVFSTSTKKDAADVSKETLKAICEAVNIPVIAIGGIGADNILSLQGSGICGIAVVSAIFAAKDIEAATKVLKEFRLEDAESFEIGSEIKADVFAAGDKVDVTGVSKGHGYQGPIKRHGQSRGPMGHGSKFHRAVGSMGASSDPSKTFKNKYRICSGSARLRIIGTYRNYLYKPYLYTADQ